MSDISLSKAVRTNLLSLQNTASMMTKTQERLATGNKVNSALDNPTNFFTASALNSRAADMNSLIDSMGSGISTLEAANNGLTSITTAVTSMQSTLRQARQDKSFQSATFDVTEKSTLTLNGGQFTLPETASLKTKVDGVKAELQTASATAYLGPVSTTDSAQGAGARTLLTNVTTSATTGIRGLDEITVAGVTVVAGAATKKPDGTVDLAAVANDGVVSNDQLAANIKEALAADASTAGKYSVAVGTGANAGKIIIETVDPEADAAEVVFSGDTVATTEVGAATKGSTTFNYGAITSSVTAGGQTIPTGATFDDFVDNLKDGEKAGNYTVTFDATTKDITLTSNVWGGAAPGVTGVPVASNAVTGTKGETSFDLSNLVTATALDHDQDLTISGAATPIQLTAGMSNTDVRDEILAHTDLSNLYDVDVDTNFTVTLKQKVATTGAAPTVTSSQVASPAVPATIIGAAGLDFSPANANASVTALEGTTITLDKGTGTPTTYTIATGDDMTDLMTGLNLDGFTVTGSATGLNFARADGTNFDVVVSGGASTQLGLGASTTSSTNGALAETGGITGGHAATIVGAGGDNLTVDANVQALAGLTIDLDDGAGNTTSYLIGVGSTTADLQSTLSDNGFLVKATANGLDITRADGTNFSVSISGGNATDLGFGSASVTSTDGTPPVVTTTPGVADQDAVVGQTVTAPIQGASLETVEASKDTFNVTYDGVTAEINIGSVMGGIDSAPNALDKKTWQDETIAKVNAQLIAKGITGVEAAFDEDGKFSIVAKNAEHESVSVSGKDANRLFGADTTDTGTAAVQAYSSVNTVDKFVEEINKTYSGKLRASNDKGQLRIENLSTVALDVSIDKDGATGPLTATTTNIAGNDVRKNAALAFNALRDQLDKFADDASFSGINLLRGDKMTLTFNETGTSSIDIQAKDASGATRAISSANLDIDNLESTDLDNDSNIDALLAKLSTSLVTLRAQASSFGSNLSSVQNRQDFTKNMINTLQTGAANLTLADTNEEAANLLALQTRQQLSSSALSMASQQDQAVLQLLR